MSSSRRSKPAQKRNAPRTGDKEKVQTVVQPTAEDERDLRDAERARAEAKRKGVYPWEWLKQELE